MSDAGIHSGNAPKPVGHYPHARRVGEWLYLSGVGPRDPSTNSAPGNVYAEDGSLASYDIAAQTHSVFANVGRILADCGASWDDVIDVTAYLTDMARDFTTYNAIWAEYFPDAARAPCRTTLGITALPAPIAIEFKCVALLPASPSAT